MSQSENAQATAIAGSNADAFDAFAESPTDSDQNSGEPKNGSLSSTLLPPEQNALPTIDLNAANAAKIIREVLAQAGTAEHKPGDRNIERLKLAVEYLDRNPDRVFPIPPLPDATSKQLEATVVDNVLGQIDGIRGSEPRRMLMASAMSQELIEFAKAHPDNALAPALADGLRTAKFNKVRFVVSAIKELTPADIVTLQTQMRLVKPNEPITISLLPATLKSAGMTAKEKAELKTRLESALSANRSWSTVHDTLAEMDLVYRLSAGESNGVAYRGAVIDSIATGKSVFAVKPGEIGFGLKKLETQLGDFTSRDQIASVRKNREAAASAAAEAALAQPANGPPTPGPAPAQTATASANAAVPSAPVTFGPAAEAAARIEGATASEPAKEAAEAASATVGTQRAVGSIKQPPPLESDRAEGSIGSPASGVETAAEIEQTEWSKRLQAVDDYEKAQRESLKASLSETEIDAALSALALESLMRRARINIRYHPHAALAEELSSAPPPYRSHGTRFEFDRFQRSVASLEAVPTGKRDLGTAVFIGRAHALPAFYDLGDNYKFTALTGAQPDAMKLAVMAAERRWGSLTINGNAAFQKRALEAAAELNVKVANPELQEQWQQLRDRFEAAAAKTTIAFERTIAAAPPDQKLPIIAFGQTAKNIDPEELHRAVDRTIKNFIVRGHYTHAEREVVVLETVTGKLEVHAAHEELFAGGHVKLAEQNGIYGAAGISFVSGASKPIEIDLSSAINDQLQQTTEGRKKGMSKLVAAEAQVQAQNEKWQDVGDKFVHALANRHWAGPVVLAAAQASQHTQSRPSKDRPAGRKSKPYDVEKERNRARADGGR